MSWTNNFLNVSAQNEALQFLNKRIMDEGYRGKHLSQHNRFNMNQVIIILKLLNEACPDKSLMQIRTTDLHKRPQVIAGEEKYSAFCADAKLKISRGTEDTMRKNFFPDFHRMGLIKRYDKNQKETDPYKQTRVKYVSLTNLGINLITYNALNRFFVYSNGLGILLEGMTDILLVMLRNKDYDLGYIDITEYQFFITAIGIASSFSINVKKAVYLIKRYRLLSRAQKKAVLDTLYQDLKPNNKYAKNKQRDYGNWRNEAEQVYDLLNQIVYFDVIDNKITLTTGKNGKYENTSKLLRSYSEKQCYFKKHRVPKKEGFELHHIVPLGTSESQEHFKILDNWQNMLYIDAYSHAKITQNKNKNIILTNNEQDLILKDYSEHKVELKKDENMLYKYSNQSIILKYNQELLKSKID